MKRPKEIENRIDREIVIGVQSFNVVNLNDFLSILQRLINRYRANQEEEKRELKDYVWINTIGRN